MLAAVTALIGVTGALVYGAADFLGGLAAKRISALRVTLIAALTGLAGLLLASLAVGGSWSVEAIALGAASGVSGALAVSLLYACLALGPMSVLSPITAVVSAVIPLLWGLARGERLAALAYVGLVLALVAVVLVAVTPERGAAKATAPGISMAVGAGLMIGVFLVLIDATPTNSGLIPLLANRAVNAVLMSAAIAVLTLTARRRGAPAGAGWRPGLALAVGCGLLDTLANVLLLVGVRIGDLSIISVLAAMYPAGTILLAAVVLKERITPLQFVGLVLALTAAALLALA